MRNDGVMRHSIVLLVALAASLLATGCSQTPRSPAAPTTVSPAASTTASPAGPTTASPTVGTACRDVFNAVRCQVMTVYVATQLGTTREQVASLVVIPQPTPETINGVTILQTTSGGPPVDVEVTLRDASVYRMTLNCSGISGVECQNNPRLEAWSVMHGGYYDGTEAQLLGGPPSIAPDALADAMPLRIGQLDIPVDHTGLNEIPIGEARLPNGILTAVDFALVEDWPTGVSILYGGVRLEIRSVDDGGTPITNIYAHGWRPGTERVQAVLVFDVAAFDPGATLAVKDIVVR